MKSDKIVVQRQMDGIIYKPEVDVNELKKWIDEVETTLDSTSQALIDMTRLVAKCVSAINTQKDLIANLQQDVSDLRDVVRGMLETQAQMQINKADRSELR